MSSKFFFFTYSSQWPANYTQVALQSDRKKTQPNKPKTKTEEEGEEKREKKEIKSSTILKWSLMDISSAEAALAVVLN